GFRRAALALGASATALAFGLLLTATSPASAATTIDGPVGLGTAASFGVLGASAVTNTGPSSIAGDLGVSPDTSITGFPPGTVGGTTHADTVSAQAQADTTTAYDVAASLSPTSSGLADLAGLNLAPGVYSGGALTLSGTLDLTGSATSVWVFQATSSLITSSGSTVAMHGGATACNVFWKVGSSATLGTGSTLFGTVMALASISTGSATTVNGRLLARTGAVTLDNTTVNPPPGCSSGTVTASPTITSGAPTPVPLDAPYSFALTATGSGVTTFQITAGALPPGLTLDSATGLISGTATQAGTFAVTVGADNGIAPAASASYQLVVSAVLAETGTTSTVVAPFALGAVLLGLVLVVARARRGSPRH
ncbi:MAG: ice-binding family protein, partial [Leifsonia sp.]